MSVAQRTSPPAVWDRVVCGIDFTPASVQAALLAAQLMPASAQLTLCTVASREAIEAGVLLDETLARDAKHGLDEIQRQVQAFHDNELHLREGPPIRRLLDELSAERATLVAVGSHGHSRAAGIVLGSVATAMLHEAPCSVLIAHPTARTDIPGDGELVVGYDGSGGARRTLEVGRELAERVGLELRVIVATGDAHPPGPGWSRDELGSELAVSEDPRAAVEALVDASRSARLLVVGSRHLRGVPALSSVSERVAHRASCPVLVIR
jgi:nucleotide-binding universal stress UspA family protein